MKRRVVINGRFLTQHITGVQRYAIELVLALDELLASLENFHCHVQLALPSRGQLHRLPLKSIESCVVGKCGGHLWEQSELAWFSRGSTLLCLGNSSPVLQTTLGGKLVVTMHDVSYRTHSQAYSLPYRLWHHFLGEQASRHANAIITVSHAVRQQIEASYPLVKSKIHVVHHGANHRYAQELNQTSLDETLPTQPYLLVIGSLNPMKNTRTVLRAYEKISYQHPELELVVVGGLASVFHNAGLLNQATPNPKIHWLGQIDNPHALRQLYRHATALIFPSYTESFGLPCLEAMREGCPVIASNLPALREVCGDVARFIEPDDVETLCHHVCHLLEQPDSAQELKELGLQHSQKFTWQACARQTWSIVEQVMSQ